MEEDIRRPLPAEVVAPGAGPSGTLAALGVEYLALQEKLLDSLRRHGVEIDQFQFIDQQLAAADRLRSRLHRLKLLIDQTRSEMEIRENQAERFEREQAVQKKELQGLQEVLERNKAWLSSQKVAAHNHQQRLDLLRQRRDTLAVGDLLQSDEEILQVNHRYNYLLEAAQLIEDQGVSTLRTRIIQTKESLQQLLEATHNFARSDDFLLAMKNLQILSTLFGPEAVDDPALETRVNDLLLESITEIEQAEKRSTQLELDIADFFADRKGRATELYWLQGELNGLRRWNQLSVDKEAPQETLKLEKDVGKMQEEVAAEESELIGRQAQLAWLQGEIAARALWQSLADQFNEGAI